MLHLRRNHLATETKANDIIWKWLYKILSKVLETFWWRFINHESAFEIHFQCSLYHIRNNICGLRLLKYKKVADRCEQLISWWQYIWNERKDFDLFLGRHRSTKLARSRDWTSDMNANCAADTYRTTCLKQLPDSGYWRAGHNVRLMLQTYVSVQPGGCTYNNL